MTKHWKQYHKIQTITFVLNTAWEVLANAVRQEKEMSYKNEIGRGQIVVTVSDIYLESKDKIINIQ